MSRLEFDHFGWIQYAIRIGDFFLVAKHRKRRILTSDGKKAGWIPPDVHLGWQISCAAKTQGEDAKKMIESSMMLDCVQRGVGLAYPVGGKPPEGTDEGEIVRKCARALADAKFPVFIRVVEEGSGEAGT